MKSRENLYNYLKIIKETIGIDEDFEDLFYDWIEKNDLKYFECMDALMYSFEKKLLNQNEVVLLIGMVQDFGFEEYEDFDSYVEMAQKLMRQENDTAKVLQIFEKMYLDGEIEKDMLIGIALELDVLIDLPDKE